MRLARSRLRAELRDLVELVLLPGLAAVIPWPLCFRLFRWASRWRRIYRLECEQALAEAQRYGYVENREEWLQKHRLVLLVDHADLYLARWRSDGWMRRHLAVEGRWPDPGEPAVLCTFHWGAGMWALRHVRASGLSAHALIAPFPAKQLSERRVRLGYVRSRYDAVRRSLGNPPLEISDSLRPALQALKRNEQVLAAVDVPPSLVKATQELAFLGHRARMPKGLFRVAADQQLGVAVYLTGLNYHTGRRALKILQLPKCDSAEELMIKAFALLEEAIRRDPPAWHFWGAIESFMIRRPKEAPKPSAAAAPTWNPAKIRDEWFRAHFCHAADVVGDWLAQYLDFPSCRLMDFGCGDGITDLAIALKKKPLAMTGIDINESFEGLAALARKELDLDFLPAELRFSKIEPGARLYGRLEVDAIISWSAFEHIETHYLDQVVADLFELLPYGGYLFIQIDPLFHSPFGSHLGRFVRQPWAHLLLDDSSLWKTVLESNETMPADEVEANFHIRSMPEYKKFVFDEYHKLNRLTADRLVEYFVRHGFSVIREERRLVEDEPPELLKNRFNDQDLRTAEIRLLLRKQNGIEGCARSPDGPDR